MLTSFWFNYPCLIFRSSKITWNMRTHKTLKFDCAQKCLETLGKWTNFDLISLENVNPQNLEIRLCSKLPIKLVMRENGVPNKWNNFEVNPSLETKELDQNVYFSWENCEIPQRMHTPLLCTSKTSGTSLALHAWLKENSDAHLTTSQWQHDRDSVGRHWGQKDWDYIKKWRWHECYKDISDSPLLHHDNFTW